MLQDCCADLVSVSPPAVQLLSLLWLVTFVRGCHGDAFLFLRGYVVLLPGIFSELYSWGGAMFTGGGDLQMMLMGMDEGTLGVARVGSGHLVCVYAEVRHATYDRAGLCACC